MCQEAYSIKMLIPSIQHTDVKQSHTDKLDLQWQQTRCYFQRDFLRTQSLRYVSVKTSVYLNMTYIAHMRHNKPSP